MTHEAASAGHGGAGHDENRRDFIFLVAGGMGAIGAATAIWPFILSMSPSADVLALASTEVDISGVAEGQSITVKWRGKPVFIRHRTAAEIAAAEAVPAAGLRDPQSDAVRVLADKKQWLVVVGVCTHLGCVPLGQKTTEKKGEFGGWFCPCHGSHYDTSGRIRKGPAPKNLPVPEYTFLDDTHLRIG
ncbi:MAG: ubiquinol-cytochrome c reductase iron-sulfur subunit [Alphaproteobacteria bacterium]|nr:ubiquinol-cytochrome c reductase iron-sulfur subunit [Alphaproteobacteria bacterium]